MINGAELCSPSFLPLIDEAGLGMAPGAAFGPAGEGWLRWCFASTPERLDAGIAHLADWLANTGSKRA